MTPTLGKLAPTAFHQLIAPHLGRTRPEVLVGPRPGGDCGIVRVGAGRIVAITTDPLSMIPALGFSASARMSCHLLASDLWTSAVPPAYASVCLNLPPHMSDQALAEYSTAMSDEWAKLEVAVVTGHTGRYVGCDFSIVGSATLIGLGEEHRYLTTAMASPGDRVIVTKGCAIEATAIAARLFPERLGRRLDADGMARARAMLDQVSVVADCRAALGVGVRDRGVSALHDATEGGVLGGLVELAKACGHDLRIERTKIPLSREARAACEEMEIDPYWALSEGTLIAAVRSPHAAAVLDALKGSGIAAAEVGEVVPGAGRVWLTEPDGAVKTLTAAEPDPYWPAYDRAVKEGWR